ncbi:MAG TPA: hypothetical protein VG389_02355 [Myxococcota bacterium]|jgi:hypothetical protein|nr:hypothetical protein [Myxococcota bacterium]
MATSQLHCTNCDLVFDKPDTGRGRCPKCMRTHGLEPVAGPGAAGGTESSTAGRGQSGRGRVPIAAGAIVGAAALLLVGYLIFRSPGHGAVGMSADALKGALAAAGVAADLQVTPFAGSPAVRTFGGAAVTSGGDGPTVAKGVLAVFDALRTAGKVHPASPYRESVRAPQPSDALATAVPAGTVVGLSAYEAAALMLAAVREGGVADAQIAEAYALPGRPSPDPTGMRGYFVVLLGAGTAAATFFDPLSGGSGPASGATLRPLSDVQAVAPYLVLQALNALSTSLDSAAANRYLEAAEKLDADSPTVRAARGATFAASGPAGVTEAVAQFERALAARPDAARHVALAEILLAMASEPSDLERVKAEVTAALALDPNLASAHALQATLFLYEKDLDHARASLDKAVAGGLEGPRLAMIKSRIVLEGGDIDGAIKVLQDEIARGESVDQLSISLIEILMRAGRVTDAQDLARSLVATSKHGEMLKGLLAELLSAGPPGAGAGPGPGAPSLGAPDFGAPGPGAGGPSLLGGGGAPGPLGAGAKKPSLLGGERLKLDVPMPPGAP